MRFLKWTAIILAILVTGLWFGASYFVKKGAEAFVADLAAKGMVAGTPGISVGGFPARMDLALSAVKFVDPKTGAGWEGAELHIFAPSWKPWQITAELPPSQTLTLPGMTGNQTVGVTSQGLTASVRVSPDPRLALQEVTAGGAALQATSSLGWVVGVGDLRAQLLVAAADPKAYAPTLNATEIAPDPTLAAAPAAVSPPDWAGADLPATLERPHLGMQRHIATTLDQRQDSALRADALLGYPADLVLEDVSRVLLAKESLVNFVGLARSAHRSAGSVLHGLAHAVGHEPGMFYG